MGRLIRNSALLFITVIFTVFFVFWANQVELDEMTRIQGVVIPSSKEKVIQSEFNGRLTDIRVKLGDRLAAGDLIARVSNEEMLADRESVREDLLRSNGSIHRIESMQSMEIPSFSSTFVKEVLQGRADIALEQVEIARTALSAYREEMTLIQNQRDQTRQKISDALSELRGIEDSVRLVREEQNIIAPMVEKGYEPRLRLVQIKQKLQDAQAKENKLKNQVSLLELSYDELDTKLNKLLSDFQANLAVEYADATASLKKAEVELSKVDRRLRAANIVSPDDGIVTSLEVTTVGQVIGAGHIIATLVPVSDELVIEGELPPSAINFVSIDQPANVLLSAYDAQTDGKLVGNVTKIGANTQTNDDGSSFYPIQIIVRDKSFDIKKDKQAEFIPGMEATVELIGEKRTIAAYLMKPMDKMRSEAFRER
jgi:adhesin transport system membrane fusion protein